MDINFDGVDYKLHIVNKDNYKYYKDLLETLNICDANYVSKGYENLSYTIFESDDEDEDEDEDEYEDISSYLGFFVSDKNNSLIYLSLIVDLNCNQIKEKLLTPEQDEEGNDVYDMSMHSIDFDKSVEIVLLCSNSEERVRGLTSFFLTNVINRIIPMYKPNVENILLSVAQGTEENPRATDFYARMGFKIIKSNVMKYIYSGGKKRNKSGKYRSRKYIHRAKSKRRKTSNRKSRKGRGRKGGIGKIPDHRYLYFDKDNLPLSYQELTTMIGVANRDRDFNADNIFTKLKNDAGTFSGRRKTSAIYLFDANIRTIFGYIIGYVSDDDEAVLSFVQLHSSVRGKGMCLEMLDAYLKNMLPLHPEIQTFQLYNIGGEPSCRCYKKAFEMNGFTLRDAVDCSQNLEEGKFMIFYKN